MKGAVRNVLWDKMIAQSYAIKVQHGMRLTGKTSGYIEFIHSMDL